MPRRDVSQIGRYEIQRRLGVGGMGTLYLARDPRLDRLVAIKLLKEDFQDDPKLRERFIREARSVARLRHPNIVVVHDVGEDDGRPFMAMEYIAGETLTDALLRTPSLPMTRRLALIEDLCAGLAHAHTAGIIHRDIKPENIMLDGEGVLKILDFGIARLVDSGMTQEGMMMGTLNYMSPEQVAGRGVDHRTDIFATGAVLYEVIALEQAFPGRIDAGVLYQILHQGPVPLEQRVPGLAPELAAIVRRALDPVPGRRYQDANVMRQDLSRVRRKWVESEDSAEAGVDRVTALYDPLESSQAEAGPKAGSDRPRRLSPERLAELRRQQVEEQLRFAEEAFARDDHEAALQHAERAATADPDSREAMALIDRARLAIEGKAIRRRLGEAQRLLADGHLEDAAAVAEEASATLPDIHGATDLRREVRQTIEQIAAVRQREQRMAASLARAQSSLDQGAYDTALRAVYEALALDPDRPEARALEQQVKSLVQAQRKHELERQSAYDKLARAQSLASQSRFDEAIEEIAAVSGPSDTVRVAAAAALTAVRRAQRLAAQAVALADAQAAFERGQFEEARSLVDSIPAEERTAAARALHVDAAKALEAQRQLRQKQQALEAALRTAQELVNQDNLARALEQLEEAAAIGLDDERIPTLRRQIKDLVTAAENKRRQEARDRADQEERARKEAERRRQEEEARRRAEAEALRKLEEQRKAEEERQAEERRRRNEEERRQRDMQRQRRREELATLVAEAEAALADHRPDAAPPLLKRVDEQVVPAEDADLQQRVDLAKAEADRQIRQRQEETRRRENEARQREREEEARQREEEARREQALVRILTKVQASPDHQTALDLLSEALTLAPADSRVQTLVEERRSALTRQRAEEERRQQEARRQEEERRIQEEQARRHAEAEAARLREQRRREAENQRLDEEERQRRQGGAELARERERLELQARDARAAEIVERARQLSASGRHEEAVKVLRGAAANPATRLALEELESQRAQIPGQRQRVMRARIRPQRRAAAVLAWRRAINARGLWLLSAAFLSVTVGWAVWQYRPQPAPAVEVTPSPSPSPSPEAGPERVPPNTPKVESPGGTTTPPEKPPRSVTETVIVEGRAPTTPGPSDPATGRGRPEVQEVPPAKPSPGPEPGRAEPPPGQPPRLPDAAVPAPPPVVTPTPEPSRPIDAPQPDLAAEDAAIREHLNRYVAAYNAMDVTRLREIDPNFKADLNRVVLKSVELRLSDVAIKVASDGTAVLTATQNFRYEWNRPGPRTSSGPLTWNLRKIGGTWTVVP